MTSGHDKRLERLESRLLARKGPTLHIAAGDDPLASLTDYRAKHHCDPLIVIRADGKCGDPLPIERVHIVLPANGRD